VALTDEQKLSLDQSRRLSTALAQEARAHAQEAKRREWSDKGMYLTREQAAAGAPCRGCGLPVIDGLGSWPPLMQLTNEQRQDREEADALFSERHKDCHAHRWSMEGSRTTHCGLCCPPLPLSPTQIETLSRILNDVTRREEELDVWTLTLTCGHRVEREVHHMTRYWIASTVPCGECRATCGVVTSERTVEAADRQAEIQRKRASDLARVEKEIAKAEGVAAAAREKLAALKARQ
jgi:hypothetical protein